MKNTIVVHKFNRKVSSGPFTNVVLRAFFFICVHFLPCVCARAQEHLCRSHNALCANVDSSGT